MNTKAIWKEGMQFDTVSGEHHVSVDAKAPMGRGHGFTPKELVLGAIAGCTGMDVVALLRKNKQSVKSFTVDCQASPTTEGHPAVFKNISVTYKLEGTIEPAKALEAVQLSQTQYCGVSAMISKAVPIDYTVTLNGEQIGTGRADFK